MQQLKASPADEADDDDVETNLLRPAGIQMRPATFIVRLFCAEDLPRSTNASALSQQNLAALVEHMFKSTVQ